MKVHVHVTSQKEKVCGSSMEQLRVICVNLDLVVKTMNPHPIMNEEGKARDGDRVPYLDISMFLVSPKFLLLFSTKQVKAGKKKKVLFSWVQKLLLLNSVGYYPPLQQQQKKRKAIFKTLKKK